MISGGRDTRRKKEVGELKSTGIVRPVDNLGRIVLPIELRRSCVQRIPAVFRVASSA